MTELRDVALALGPVELRLPADPAMSKVVRLSASGVASLLGYDVEEIEEIKLAVSEVLIALIEHGTGEAVELRFLVSQEEFTVRARTEAGGAVDLRHPDLELCRVVLADVCTEHSLTVTEGTMRIAATLRRPFLGIEASDGG